MLRGHARVTRNCVKINLCSAMCCRRGDDTCAVLCQAGKAGGSGGTGSSVAGPVGWKLTGSCIARLTVDEDVAVVHHCMENRRDLHAEFPPGSGVDAGNEQGIAATGAEELGCSGAVPCGDAGTADVAGAVNVTEPETSVFRVSRGTLEFPLECAETLEAILHLSPAEGDNNRVITKNSLPPIEDGCEITVMEVLKELCRARILVKN